MTDGSDFVDLQTQSASRLWWDSHAFSRRIPLNRRPPQVDLKEECRRENSCVNLPIGPWLPANAATKSITVPGSAWIPARLGRRCAGRKPTFHGSSRGKRDFASTGQAESLPGTHGSRHEG